MPQTCWHVHVAWKSGFIKQGKHSKSGTNVFFEIFSNIFLVILSMSSNAELVTVEDVWKAWNVILKSKFVETLDCLLVTNTISSISSFEIARVPESTSSLKARTVTEFLRWERRSDKAYWEMLLESILTPKNPKLK